MAEGDDLIEKADALMQRHRVFVAGAMAATPEPPPLEADDVPVLTEVVAELPTASATPAASPLDIESLRSTLAFELEAWLDEELPQHIMRVLDGITDQLIIQLSLKARADLLPRLQATLQEVVATAAKPGATSD